MIYPVILQSRLLTTNEVGERDEICFEGRAMAALREDGTWSVRYTDAENHGQTALQGANSWVSVSRDGDTKSRLLFRVGERVSMSHRKENLIWLHRLRTLINKFKQTFQK